MSIETKIRAAATTTVDRAFRWEENRKRRSETVQAKFTEAEFQEYTELQKTWKELTKRGIKEGWLEYGNGADYNLLGETDLHFSNPARTVEQLESEEEYAERLADLNEERNALIEREIEKRVNSASQY